MAPTVLLIAGYVWFTRRQMGGFAGGAGGRGLFNVGKAQVRGLERRSACLCAYLQGVSRPNLAWLNAQACTSHVADSNRLDHVVP